MKATRGQANPAAVNELLESETGVSMLKEGDRAPDFEAPDGYR